MKIAVVNIRDVPQHMPAARVCGMRKACVAIDWISIFGANDLYMRTIARVGKQSAGE